MTEKRFKILVVDDDPINLRTLENLLKKDYRLIAAETGEQAIENAFAKPQPDLILLDIMMPDVDGYEVCSRLKAEPTTRHIPVIFISAKDEEMDETKGLELGAVDYISKPISTSIVLARVRTQLKLKRAYEDLKNAYEELEQKNATLEKVAILRENVERIIHHDLKNPLNGLIGACSLIMGDEELDEKHLEMIKIIEESSYRMLEIINNSLDLYKMETGIYQYHPNQIDILHIIKKIVAETTAYTTIKNLSVQIMLNAKPATNSDTFFVYGEYLLCYSMLANLFKNALEASPTNAVITVFLDGTKTAIICIHNQGLVPEEIRDNFFDKFVSMGKSNGTGLGTYSAKLMAEIQGGNIQLETLDKNGTCVTVRLPRYPNKFLEDVL